MLANDEDQTVITNQSNICYGLTQKYNTSMKKHRQHNSVTRTGIKQLHTIGIQQLQWCTQWFETIINNVIRNKKLISKHSRWLP